MKDLRALLSMQEARGLLALPEDCQVPETADLLADAELILSTNHAVAKETAHLVANGLQVSPIWDVGTKAGATAPVLVRMAVLPVEFRSRYFEGEGAEVLGERAAIELVCDVVPWLADDPVGAAFALEDTLRVWLDDTAPTRTLEIPYRGHYKLLSLLLADIARKGSAGLDSLEWLGSIGLPIEESRDADDPPTEQIRANMKLHLQDMWEQERRWLAKAFGR